MFKRMFQFSSSENITEIAPRNGSPVRSPGLVKLSTALDREPAMAATENADVNAVPPVCETFGEVYDTAGIRKASNYSIMKVADMLDSKHLADMSPDSKRNSLMMALEAAGVEIGELLQDAVSRNRALDEYEEKRQDQVKSFENVKADENNKLHTELERLTSQYMARIQANSDLVAQEQDRFRAWQKRKQQESQRITDAATFCVPQGNNANGSGSLTAVLERVTVARR